MSSKQVSYRLAIYLRFKFKVEYHACRSAVLSAHKEKLKDYWIPKSSSTLWVKSFRPRRFRKKLLKYKSGALNSAQSV